MTTTLPALERWLPIPGYKKFLLSSTGRVYDIAACHPLTPQGEGDLASVTLVDDLGRTYQRNISQVVFSVFGHSPRSDEALRDPVVPLPGDIPPDPNTEKDPDGVVTDIAWRAVVLPDVLEGYQVSELGEVLSPTGNIIAAQARGTSGKSPKLTVSLGRPSGTGYVGNAMVRLDDVVAGAFLPPRPSDQHFPEHINGDWRDCRAENLRWGKTGRMVKPKSIDPKPAKPTPTRQSSPEDDAVEIITTTVYRYQGIEVTSYPGGRWEHPPMTPANAAALARIFREIGQRTVGE